MKPTVIRRSAALMLALLLALFALFALADIPKAPEDFYYYDEVGILSSETKSLIFSNGEALKKACGAQIVVVVVKTFGGMSADDYAYKIINNWGVGDKSKNNGIVLAIAETDGVYRMTVGTGLERYMDSAWVQSTLDKYFQPSFKDYKTEKGILQLYPQLFNKLKDIYRLNLTMIDGDKLPQEMIIEDKKGGGFQISPITILIIILIVILIIKNARKNRRGTVVRHDTRPSRPVVVINPRPFFGGRPRPPRGGFGSSYHSSSFGSSRSSGSSSRSSGGSFRSGGFGGARGGGGHGRGVGGGGRR